MAAVVLIAAWYLLTSDGIPAGNGMGWDGVIYGGLAQDFPGRYHAGVTSYYVSRLFPSFLIYWALRLFGVARTAPHVVTAFRVMNGLLVIAGGGLWIRIARDLRLGVSGRILGFTGLFLNLAIAKMPAFYPVLTDVPAFFLGLCMLLAALERRFVLLLVVTAIGRFVWPTAVFVGALLLLAPRDVVAAVDRRARAFGVAGTLALVIVFVAFTAQLVSGNLRIWGSITDLVRPVWPLSLALAACYLALTLMYPASWAFAYMRKVRIRHVANVRTPVTLAVLAGVSFLAARLTNASGSEMPMDMIIKLTCWTSVTMPLQFLVAHVLYFGPIVLLLVASWPNVQARVAKAGFGLVLTLGLTLALSLNSESRYLSNLWPMLVPFLAQDWDGRLSPGQLGLFVSASLLFSKVWLLIGAPADPLGEYPAQLYFMNQGPWMSGFSYAVQGGALLALASLFHAAGLFAARTKPAENW
jgi:hypothetical protein